MQVYPQLKRENESRVFQALDSLTGIAEDFFSENERQMLRGLFSRFRILRRQLHRKVWNLLQSTQLLPWKTGKNSRKKRIRVSSEQSNDSSRKTGNNSSFQFA
jgi:hypothetical protein